MQLSIGPNRRRPVPTPKPSQACSFSSTSLSERPCRSSSSATFSAAAIASSSVQPRSTVLALERLDAGQHLVEIRTGGPGRPAKPAQANPAPHLLEHRLDLGGCRPLADRLADPVSDHVERDEADGETRGGPPLDGLDLDRQYPLIGRRQGRGLDLASCGTAAECFEQVLLGDVPPDGLDIGGGWLGAGLHLRPRERQGVDRPILGREQEVPDRTFWRAVEAGDLGCAELDHVPVDRFGAAVRVRQPPSVRAHPRTGHVEPRVVERRHGSDRHHGIALDSGDPSRDRQPLAPGREVRVEQPQAVASGEVKKALPTLGIGCLDPENAEDRSLEGGQGGPLVGIGRPVLAGEAVDSRRPGGRGREQGTVDGKRQCVSDRACGTVLILCDPPVREPVPCRLVDLGLGHELHRREAQCAHKPAQELGMILEAPRADRWSPVRCRSRHRFSSTPWIRLCVEPLPTDTVFTPEEQRHETKNLVSLELLNMV